MMFMVPRVFTCKTVPGTARLKINKLRPKFAGCLPRLCVLNFMPQTEILVLNRIYFYNCWFFKVKIQNTENQEIFIFIIPSLA